jgi:NADH dehydrogenase
MILVSGGTGFIGTAVVAELKRRGEEVAVLGRSAAKIKARFGDIVEVRQADVRDPATLGGVFTGVDTVINCVQFPNYPIENKRRGLTFKAVDLAGTRNQVDAAKTAGVRRFVYLSGVGVAPDAAKHWFRAKAEAEAYLEASGLEWTVVRPSWVYGPGDKSLNRLIGFSRFLPFVPNFGDGKQPMQPAFIDDVGRVVAEAALSSACVNERLEIGGPEVLSMDAVLKTALDVMGRRRFVLYQPVFIGRVIGTIASFLPGPPLTADAVEFVISPAVADNSRLEAVLHPRLTPLREGLSTYVAR